MWPRNHSRRAIDASDSALLVWHSVDRAEWFLLSGFLISDVFFHA